MARKIFTTDELELLSDPTKMTWLQHLKFSIEGFAYLFWEVVARRNKQYISHKAAALFIDDGLVEQITERGYCERGKFFELLHRIHNNAELLVLHVERPYTYFPWDDDGTEYGLKVNYQLELPGGQVKGKTGVDVAIQELIDEAGIGAEQVLCWTDAYPSPSANDGGTHIERYGLWYVLCTGKAHPPMSKKNPEQLREGIVGFNSVAISKLNLYKEAAAINGTPIELWVHVASFGIMASLNRTPVGLGD